MEAAETVSHGTRGREIVICEGATDCAAGYAIGLATVGRSRTTPRLPRPRGDEGLRLLLGLEANLATSLQTPQEA